MVDKDFKPVGSSTISPTAREDTIRSSTGEEMGISIAKYKYLLSNEDEAILMVKETLYTESILEVAENHEALDIWSYLTTKFEQYNLPNRRGWIQRALQPKE